MTQERHKAPKNVARTGSDWSISGIIEKKDDEED